MCSASIFPCLMTMTSNFTIFVIFQTIYFQIFPYKYNRFLHFYMISAAVLLIISSFFFLKLIVFIAVSLKDSQNFFIQSLPLYTLWLFSMLLNEDIVDGLCLVTFVVDIFSRLFLHPSIFCIIH